MDFITQILQENFLLAALLALIGLDVISGILAAFALRKVSSVISFRGAGKKMSILFIVAVASILQWVIQRLLGQMWPLAGAAFLFYIVTEAISILENAGSLGLPVPTFLTEALITLREKANGGRRATDQPTGGGGILE